MAIAAPLTPNAGRAQQTEDQDRVQNEIQYDSCDLKKHGCNHIARRLDDFLNADMKHISEGHEYDDIGKVEAELIDRRIVGVGVEERFYYHQCGDGHQRSDNSGKNYAVGYDIVRPVLVFGAQPPRNQRVGADSEPDGYGQDQCHDRKSERYCSQRILAEPGDKHAVYEIIGVLQKHGCHRGKGHRNEQRNDGLHTHLVCRYGVFLSFYGTGHRLKVS